MIVCAAALTSTGVGAADTMCQGHACVMTNARMQGHLGLDLLTVMCPAQGHLVRLLLLFALPFSNALLTVCCWATLWPEAVLLLISCWHCDSCWLPAGLLGRTVTAEFAFPSLSESLFPLLFVAFGGLCVWHCPGTGPLQKC